MPRSTRLDFPGARHHVMNRTARREAMFVDDATCAAFVDTLAVLPREYGVRIHGFALMPNHFHAMLETPEGNLSRAMQALGARFTQVFNRSRAHDGPVFRGRFRSQLVTDDAYWAYLLAYLHLNPVRAGLAAGPADCLWTSHNAYVGAAPCPDWLTVDELRASLGGAGGVAAYVADVQIHRREAPPGFEAAHLWRQRAAGVVLPEAPRPALRAVDHALADVARTLHVPVDALRSRPIGHPNERGWVAAWWLRRATSASFDEIGRALGVTRQRASTLVRQAERRAVVDGPVRAWMDALEAGAGDR